MEYADIAFGEANKYANMFLDPLKDLAGQVLGFLPNLIGAILILIIGGIIVRIVMSLLGKVLAAANIDSVFEKVGLTKELAGIGITASFSEILTGVIRVFFKLIIWMAAVDQLGIKQLTAFMNDVVNYVPNVIVAVIILAAGLAIANVAQGMVATAAKSFAKDKAAMLASIVKTAILAFTAMVVLQQVGIAGSLIDTLFAGIIGAMSIAAGIAFGLGGQDKAKEIIGKI